MRHLILFAALFSAATATAAPELVHHSGRLLNAEGQPLNGTFALRFDLMDQASGGSSSWDQTESTVVVADGYYSVELGLTDADLTGNQWLKISTDGGTTELGRQRLASVPYALRTVHADTASGLVLPPVAGGTGPAACTAAENGTVRYNQDLPGLQLCVPDDGAYAWAAVGSNSRTLIGDDTSGRSYSDGTYARSCREYLYSDAYAGEGTGNYVIQAVGYVPTRVACDMSTDGGGWTLVFREEFASQEDGPTQAEMSSSSGDPITGEGRIDPTGMYTGLAATDVMYDLQTHKLVTPDVSAADFAWFFSDTSAESYRTMSSGAYLVGGTTWSVVRHHKWSASQGQISTNTTWDSAVILDYGQDTNHGWAIWTGGNGVYKRNGGYQTPATVTTRIWLR